MPPVKSILFSFFSATIGRSQRYRGIGILVKLRLFIIDIRNNSIVSEVGRPVFRSLRMQCKIKRSIRRWMNAWMYVHIWLHFSSNIHICCREWWRIKIMVCFDFVYSVWVWASADLRENKIKMSLSFDIGMKWDSFVADRCIQSIHFASTTSDHSTYIWQLQRNYFLYTDTHPVSCNRALYACAICL